MSVMEEVMTTGVVFCDMPDQTNSDSVVAYLNAEQAVASLNVDSAQPEPVALDAFIELLFLADQQYIEVPHYEERESEVVAEPILDWEAVALALEESQRILVMVQELLSATLADMGIVDHESIRVYTDEYGWLRVVGEHDRKVQIESTLNSAENNQLREYYMSATAGMSMAGSLVGTMAVPPEVLEQAQSRRYAVAS